MGDLKAIKEVLKKKWTEINNNDKAKKKESDLNESIKIPYIPSDLKLNFNTSDKKRD
jgi:hypothetical protein